MIRDTASQDALLTAPPAARIKRGVLYAGAAALLLLAAVTVLSGWRSSEHTVS